MLKRFLLIAIAGFFMFSCAQQPKDVQETSEIVESFTIAELYENALDLDGSDVHFEGVILHACRTSGEKIRVSMDEEGTSSVFVMLGEFSDQIGVEDEGKDISIVGTLEVLDKEEYYEKRDKEEGEREEDHVHNEDCDHAEEMTAEHKHDEDCDHAEEKTEEHVHDHDCEHEEEVEEKQKDDVKFIINLKSFEWI
ncbi:MAG: hypothetical protein ACOCWC_04015 [Bacteroidota bacterium]